METTERLALYVLIALSGLIGGFMLASAQLSLSLPGEVALAAPLSPPIVDESGVRVSPVPARPEVP